MKTRLKENPHYPMWSIQYKTSFWSKWKTLPAHRLQFNSHPSRVWSPIVVAPLYFTSWGMAERTRKTFVTVADVDRHMEQIGRLLMENSPV